MDLANLALQLVSGAAGGHFMGKQTLSSNLGPLGNALTGAIGGGLGSQATAAATGLGAAMVNAGDIGAIVAQALGSGLGGGILTLLIGMLRQTFAR